LYGRAAGDRSVDFKDGSDAIFQERTKRGFTRRAAARRGGKGVTHPKAGPMCAGMAPPMPLEKFQSK